MPYAATKFSARAAKNLNFYEDDDAQAGQGQFSFEFNFDLIVLKLFYFAEDTGRITFKFEGFPSCLHCCSFLSCSIAPCVMVDDFLLLTICELTTVLVLIGGPLLL